jgi:osmotically-inducible protein OsmY
MFAVMSSLVLLAMLALSAAAQEKKSTGEMKEKTQSTAKTHYKQKAAMPTDDAGIQKCIAEHLAASAKLKDQGFIAVVSNGEATLTGTAKNVGSKGAATRIAKSCGAKKVANNITTPAPPPPPKPVAKATGEKKEATKKP